ncbi:hypothetical protein RUM43_006795 [Polyplax serrata]|uniref:Uncharacterized protein n=1 Tax=Polyplax serrata TaxID=468196 RepID=A0AAN8PLH4_POLSC
METGIGGNHSLDDLFEYSSYLTKIITSITPHGQTSKPGNDIKEFVIAVGQRTYLKCSVAVEKIRSIAEEIRFVFDRVICDPTQSRREGKEGSAGGRPLWVYSAEITIEIIQLDSFPMSFVRGNLCNVLSSMECHPKVIADSTFFSRMLKKSSDVCTTLCGVYETDPNDELVMKIRRKKRSKVSDEGD